MWPEHRGQGQRGVTHEGTKRRQESDTVTLKCEVVVSSQTPVESHMPCGRGIQAHDKKQSSLETAAITECLLFHVTLLSLVLPQHVGLRCPILQRG